MEIKSLSVAEDDALQPLSQPAQLIYLRCLRPAAEMLEGLIPIGTNVPTNYSDLGYILDDAPVSAVRAYVEELEDAGLVLRVFGKRFPGIEPREYMTLPMAHNAKFFPEHSKCNSQDSMM